MSSRKGKASAAAATANVSSSDEHSGSSPQRKSSRLSSQSLLRQATMANFLKKPSQESPRTLFKGLSKKPLENSLTVLQNDETMILTPLPPPQQQLPVLEKSRAKRKSVHEDSFLHPSQKALVPSPVAKKKSSSSSVASSVFSTEDLRGDAVQKFWKRPKPVGRFAARRKTKESIAAEMCGKGIPVVQLVPCDRARAPVDPVGEEEPAELEFTVNSSDLDHVEIAGSKSSVASDRTKVYENLPGDSAETTAGTDTDAGGSTHDPGFGGEKMSATSSRLQSRRTNRMSEAESESLASGRRASRSLSRKSGSSAGGRVSSSYEVNSLPRAESTSTSGNSSSARASRRRSSRPSVGGSRGNTSEGESFRDSRRPSASQTRPRGGRSTSKKGAPSSAQTLSRGGRSRSQETETETDPSSETVPGPSVSGSTPARGSVSKRRLGSATPAGSRSSGAKKRVSSASGVSQDVTELSSRRRLELSLQQSTGSPRRQSSRSTPSAYRLSAPSARQPVAEAGEAETDGEPALLLANSSDEEEAEEMSRANHLDGSTARFPYTPKLPRKNVTPKSDWRNRAKTVVDTQASDRPNVAAKGASSKAARSRPRAAVQPTIPRKLTHSVFKFFADTRVSKEALEEVEQVAEEFWENVVEDLKVYAAHAGRNTIDRSDVELLLRRQRFLTEKTSLDSLIEKYMVLEDQEKLIVIARSGNRLV